MDHDFNDLKEKWEFTKDEWKEFEAEYKELALLELRVESFKRSIESVCKHHGISISHEDEQGGFIFEKYNDKTMEWFMKGYICRKFKKEN